MLWTMLPSARRITGPPPSRAGAGPVGRSPREIIKVLSETDIRSLFQLLDVAESQKLVNPEHAEELRWSLIETVRKAVAHDRRQAGMLAEVESTLREFRLPVVAADELGGRSH